MNTSPRPRVDGSPGAPLSIALVNDYEIIIHGLAAMLAPYSDRLEVVELEVGGEPNRPADVALFDTFAGRKHALTRSAAMIDDGLVEHVVLYTWDASADFLSEAARIGVSGVLLKSETASELVTSIERIADGERLGLEHVTRGRRSESDEELSAREREVLALLALGLTNRQIAEELFLSSETVKTYVKRIFTKLDVSNRVQAAALASARSLGPPPGRLDQSARVSST
ncbi:MAG: DNA-binding response regulator [Ilumatobacter sp.]|nr:MAG: DNA-binding response regulator [Ilumatobacter sp.]